MLFPTVFEAFEGDELVTVVEVWDIRHSAHPYQLGLFQGDSFIPAKRWSENEHAAVAALAHEVAAAVRIKGRSPRVLLAPKAYLHFRKEWKVLRDGHPVRAR